MNYVIIKNALYSIVAIMLCLYLGKTVHHAFGGLPGSLYGMIVLNIFLYFKMINAERLKATIEWIIKHMSVCFVPAGVGIIDHFDLVAQHGLAIVVVIFISTMALVTAVGLMVEKLSSASLENQSSDV